MKYRWLHLSDLHSYCTGIKTKIMRDDLIKEIEELDKEDKFDFIIITGDISDKNKGYDLAEEFISELIYRIGIHKNRVFIVPGNHDVNRDIPSNREDIVKTLWDGNIVDQVEENINISTLIDAQDNFFTTYKNILGREYPKDKVHFIEKVDEDINIIHLNTSWMCYDSKIEDGKICIGLNSVYNSLKDINREAFNIAIGHHRLDDLNLQERNNLKSIFRTSGIDMYLGGHCHKAIVEHDRSVDMELCFCKQARAEADEYPAGFVVGNIDVNNNQSYYMFFNWSTKFAKWMYDYSVESAKHGKYYLRGEKYNKEKSKKVDTIIDFKLMGVPLDYEDIKNRYNLKNTSDYKFGHKNISPKSNDEWDKYLKELKTFYNSIISDIKDDNIHIFPIAQIPLLVALGYLMQNDSPNIKIYQYSENDMKWVFDERDDNIPMEESFINEDNNILAVAIEVSSEIKKEDISQVMKTNYDLLSFKVDNPRLGYLNYRNDVVKMKNMVKNKLDGIYGKYKEIHLFIAAPAGLCIEIGRVIRESMYPDTYIYNYNKNDEVHYTQICNLKKLKSMSEIR
ncbi:SAVED domain-containing protein [Romboutsia sp. 1001216sp1]|uniref:SAVED domain-containing protein n=1 Tax=Romboutsia sp. 1001216sp1 TaxID=2986997 RepID=UPI00232DD764|nr:SAVED domain-containing protein [Romboutsia sp. 1001216sp1]MDB8803647.1 SAVED domain-containing protein [Romboutsia sp. 1001216sp1]MDB8807851.1 SAVED domain-containing protein [Romboutsia sp. 1001216sp1]MDB8809294.1 SAVED domain-containing protein [Romboutsia sp. 1001216sp1]MDB8815043.1 SAVED domain-containing protein [Romboutsia sp. 1001216sp1]MDB8817736.1 SAVED domain-containing protein [Romboutsia sp. 1001216sp1]